MEPLELLLIIAIAMLLVALIAWQVKSSSRKKPNQQSKEDPWDHLSSNEEKSSGKLGFGTHKIRINRNENWEEEPKIGNSANPWLKPDTDTILFYEKGSAGGAGLVGWIENTEIACHLRKEGIASATILSYDDSSCLIELELINRYKEDIEQEQKESFKARLLKPYKPKSDWSLTFNMVDGFTPDKKVHLKCLDSEEVINRNDSPHKAVWIEDSIGKKVSKHTYLNYDNLIRTLRAYYSGHNVRIKEVKKVDEQFEFTIGI